MGVIKFKGKVVFEGPIAKMDIHSNWDNSMAEYYPYVVVTYVDVPLNEIKTVRSYRALDNAQHRNQYPLTQVFVEPA